MHIRSYIYKSKEKRIIMTTREQQKLGDMIAAFKIEDGVEPESILKNPLISDILVNSQMSLMHLACHISNIYLATTLLKRGEDVNTKSGDGSYPIHMLCSNVKNVVTNLKILELLLEYKVNVNTQDSLGRTALILACCDISVPVVKLLIQAGCDVNIVDQKGNSAFSISCRLASENWYFWNSEHCNDENECLEQSNFPCYRICQALLLAGADPKQDTLLPSVILYSSKKILKEFLQLGVNVSSMDLNRRTPLGCVCSTPDTPVSMVRLLLKHGANVNEDGERKRKPIALAFVHNSVEKVRLLLSYGATLSTEEMSELVSLSLTKLFIEDLKIIHEDSVELLSWKLLIKAGFRSRYDIYESKLKQLYLCSSYFKVKKIIGHLLFPMNTLSDMCRISIRSQLTPPIDENTCHLPLPNRLKEFLKFDELFII